MISSPLSIIEATVADLTPTLTTAQEDAIVEALADASMTMREAAHQHGLTMAALSLWAARPDIQHRLSAFEDLIARQVRTSASAMLRGVALTLHQALDNYREEESNTPADYTNPRYLEQRRRARTSATQAARLLLRIADHRANRPRSTIHSPTSGPSLPSSHPEATRIPGRAGSMRALSPHVLTTPPSSIPSTTLLSPSLHLHTLTVTPAADLARRAGSTAASSSDAITHERTFALDSPLDQQPVVRKGSMNHEAHSTTHESPDSP
jgi:hypothetical protein